MDTKRGDTRFCGILNEPHRPHVYVPGMGLAGEGAPIWCPGQVDVTKVEVSSPRMASDARFFAADKPIFTDAMLSAAMIDLEPAPEVHADPVVVATMVALFFISLVFAAVTSLAISRDDAVSAAVCTFMGVTYAVLGLAALLTRAWRKTSSGETRA